MMIGGKKGKKAAMTAIICSIFMIICSVMPYYVEGLRMSELSIIIMLILGFWFTHKSILLYKNLDDHSAKKLMLSSFIYLPLSQIILVLTKYNIF